MHSAGVARGEQGYLLLNKSRPNPSGTLGALTSLPGAASSVPAASSARPTPSAPTCAIPRIVDDFSRHGTPTALDARSVPPTGRGARVRCPLLLSFRHKHLLVDEGKEAVGAGSLNRG